ncbi:MAG: hypothetical protein M0Q46_06140 [Endomicrobiales bacterium]|nr:hypothetical protein [Endomicrobiales bacterium]
MKHPLADRLTSLSILEVIEPRYNITLRQTPSLRFAVPLLLVALCKNKKKAHIN